MDEFEKKEFTKWGSHKCMKRNEDGLREVSSKMGKMLQDTSVWERIKKSARQHGDNSRERLAYLNEKVKCFAANGRK